MDVDEAGGDDSPAGVNLGCASRVSKITDSLDPVPTYTDVGLPGRGVRRTIDDLAIPDKDIELH